MKSKNLRDYASQTSFRLIVGGVVILFIVGGVLIAIFYGAESAILGILCIAAGLLPLGLIVLALWILDRIVKHGESN